MAKSHAPTWLHEEIAIGCQFHRTGLKTLRFNDDKKQLFRLETKHESVRSIGAFTTVPKATKKIASSYSRSVGAALGTWCKVVFRDVQQFPL